MQTGHNHGATTPVDRQKQKEMTCKTETDAPGIIVPIDDVFRRRMVVIEWSIAILITVAALQLQWVFFQRTGGLWRDEVCVVNMAALPSIGQVWNALPHDHCPILFPALVRVWTALGPGTTNNGLRVLGTGVGLLLLALFWVSGRVMGKKPPILSTAIILNPFFSSKRLMPYPVNLR